MFPYLNREVKSAFRWYRRSELRNRFKTACSDNNATCSYALWSANNKILPFQFVAGLEAGAGNSTPTAWVVKDLAGNTVQDLASLIPSLQVLHFLNPARDYIILEEETLIDPLPQGSYEMEITTAAGVFYSETFKVACGVSLGDVVSEPTFATCNNWNFLGASGTTLINGIFEFNSELPLSPNTGEKFVTTDDNNLWTWNGGSYDAVGLINEQFYTEGPCEPWYQFSSGGGGHFDEVAGINVPVYIDSGIACIRGEGVGLSYAIGNDLDAPTSCRLAFMFFYGSDMVGSLGVWVDGIQVATITQGQNGSGQELSLTLNTDSVIEFRPDANFFGCLQEFSVEATSDGSECLHRLTYRNCGDVGTVRYKYTDFANVVYFKRDNLFDIGEPTPVMKIENDTDEKQGDQYIFGRKDVDWTMIIGEAPWFLVDALTEIPLLREPSITFQVAGEDAPDEIGSVRVEADWTKDACLASMLIKFRVKEESTSSGCCDSFDIGCVTSCVTAYGIQDEHELVEGEIYMLNDGTYATYIGFEGGPVDENGFGTHTACPSGFAYITVEGTVAVYYTGETWFPAVYVTEVVSLNCQAGLVSVSGNVMAQYGVRIEHSTDGSVWTAIAPVFDSQQMGSGVEVTIPRASQYIRLVLVGYECDVAPSVRVNNPCYVACPIPNDFANVEATGEGSIRVKLYDEATYPDGWTFGGMEYRSGTGPWINIPFPGWDTWVDLGPGDPPSTITVRLHNEQRPDCTFEVTV